MYFGVLGAFAAVFLLARGYSNSEIGVLLALGNTIAILVQPFFAEWADRGSKNILFYAIEGITILNLVLSTLMIFQKERSPLLTVLFTGCFALLMANQPFINAVNRRLEESGERIAFGTCRSIGSLSYSVLCFFMGSIVEKLGTDILPIAGDIVLVLLAATVYATHKSYIKIRNAHSITSGPSALGRSNEQNQDTGFGESNEQNRAIEGKANAADETITLGQFMKDHKLFMVMCLGVLGLYFANTLPNAYMAQIVGNVGGDSSDVGRILSLLAITEIPTLIVFDKLYERFTTKSMLIVASIAYVLWAAAHLMANSVGMLLAAQLIHFFSFPLFLPAMVRFIDDNMREGEAVKGQTMFTVLVTLGNLTASLAGGIILDLAGAKTLLLIGTIAAAAGAAIIILMIGSVINENGSRKA